MYENQRLRDKSKLAWTINRPLAQSQQSEEMNEPANSALSGTGSCGQNAGYLRSLLTTAFLQQISFSRKSTPPGSSKAANNT